MGPGFALNSLVLNKFLCILWKMQSIFVHTSNIPLLGILDSVSISVLSFHLQAWLTEIHEYAQQDVVVMLLGNKVRTFLPMWADVWTDGLRGRREGRHCGSCMKPTFISYYLGLFVTIRNI